MGYYCLEVALRRIKTCDPTVNGKLATAVGVG